MSDTPTPAAPAASQTAAPSVNQAAEEVIKSLPQNEEIVEEDADLDTDSSEEQAPKKTEKKTPAQSKKWKLKVGGKEVEADESELVKRAQMGYSADERWQEAAKIRKEMDSLVQLLQTDPAAALERLGHNVDDLAERRIQQRIEEMKKSPEQLAKEKLERELQQLKKEMESKEEEARQKEITQLQEKFAVEIENDILGALDSDKEFPNSPYVVKRVADLMIYAMENGKTDITAKDVLPIAKKQITQELREMYSLAPDDVFEALVGKDRLNKYRKARIKRKPSEQPPTPLNNSVQATGQAELKDQQDNTKQNRKSAKNFFRNL